MSSPSVSRLYMSANTNVIKRMARIHTAQNRGSRRCPCIVPGMNRNQASISAKT
jgi:hypothetical protein